MMTAAVVHNRNIGCDLVLCWGKRQPGCTPRTLGSPSAPPLLPTRGHSLSKILGLIVNRTFRTWILPAQLVHHITIFLRLLRVGGHARDL